MKKFLLSLIILLSIFIMGCTSTTYHTETYVLKQMGIGDSISGSFFLGSGSIEGRKCFNFYAVMNKNEYKLMQADCRKSTIIESNCVTPTVKLLYRVPPLFTLKEVRGYILNYPTSQDFCTWEFTIPENSIYNSYDVNLK